MRNDAIQAGPAVIAMPSSFWRPMQPDDLTDLTALANRLHPDHPEDQAILAERQKLYPEGSRVLDVGGRIVGYLFSHPWLWLKPPPLNQMLGALPSQPTTYYIHDLALADEARGKGHAREAMTFLCKQALILGMPNLSLVAVGSSSAFWERQGFSVHAKGIDGKNGLDEERNWNEKLKSYGPGACFMSRASDRLRTDEPADTPDQS